MSIGAARRVSGLHAVHALVLRELAHEWHLTSCLIFALSAVLAPLFVLFGVKFGLVSTLSDRLLEDPRNREIVLVGSGRFDPDWFTTKARRADIGFLMPRTRAIAATMHLRNAASPGGMSIDADLIPSQAGDPLLDQGLTAFGPADVVLTRSAAEKLQVAVGDRLEGSLTRTHKEKRERVSFPLRVIGILPLGALARDAALVPLEVMLQAEDFRDGRAVPERGWEGESAPQTPRIYAGFRLYARSIRDVPRLRDALQGEGLEVRTKAAEIESVQALDRNLTLVFWIVAAIAMTGYLLSLAANLWANIERKRREFSILRLVGFSTTAIVLFPMMGAAFVAIAGAALAGLIYFPVEHGINRLFGAALEPGERVALLLPHHVLAGAGGTLICAVLASGLAGYRASRIEPAEGLRDV